MKYYTGYYGNWNSADGVRRLEPSYSRKEIMERAQKAADKSGLTVTVISKVGTCNGLYTKTIATVDPQ